MFCQTFLFLFFQIQANVKVLTCERDKLNTMYEEVGRAKDLTSIYQSSAYEDA